MPEWLMRIVDALTQSRARPGDPQMAEALNPRLGLNRRMAAEGQAEPILPDTRTPGVYPAPAPTFERPFTPEQIAAQRQRLAAILAAQQSAGAPR